MDKSIDKYSLDQNSKDVVHKLATDILLEYPTGSSELLQAFVLERLGSVLNAFSYLLWDTKLVTLALEILQVLYNASSDEFLGKVGDSLGLLIILCRPITHTTYVSDISIEDMRYGKETNSEMFCCANCFSLWNLGSSRECKSVPRR